MRPEVHQRLLFAKYLLSSAEDACARTKDHFAFTKGLLLLHDAADNALGAVADHLGANVSERMTLLQLFDPIIAADTQHRPIPYRVQLNALNSIRNASKHKGILPDVRSNLHFPSTLREFLTTVCAEYFSISFDSLSLKSLISNARVLEELNSADAEIGKGRHDRALVHLALAMFELCETSFVYSRLYSKDGKEIDWVEPYAINHAVSLLADGIDLNEYYRFKRLTPRMALDREKVKPVWEWSKDFGHEGNWTRENVDICYHICVDVALRKQARAEAGPRLVHYSKLFEDVITPRREQVPVYDLYRPTDMLELIGDGRPLQIATLGPTDVLIGQACEFEKNLSQWFILSDDLKSRTSNGWEHGYVERTDVEVVQRRRA